MTKHLFSVDKCFNDWKHLIYLLNTGRLSIRLRWCLLRGRRGDGRRCSQPKVRIRRCCRRHKVRSSRRGGVEEWAWHGQHGQFAHGRPPLVQRQRIDSGQLTKRLLSPFSLPTTLTSACNTFFKLFNSITSDTDACITIKINGIVVQLWQGIIVIKMTVL